MLRLFESGLGLAARAFDWLIAALVAALVVIVALQFVDRHFVDTGVAAPDQYARVALIWLTFIGFALALRAAVNIRVDLIDARLPPRVRNALSAAYDAVILALSLLLAVKGWKLIEIGRDQERLGTVLTEAVPAAALVLACLAIVAFLALRLALRLMGREIPSHHEYVD
ncbi:MAG TPA: TRAP transporter small permease subunit [Burkholderiales bacterium]|nr:TRAP transporter small permease subunit [Burkholderiales bacterium]